MTIDVAENPAWALRTAALGALVFDVLYVVHRLLQGLGPDDATPAGISAFNVAHRSALLASEVAVGLALLAIIVFIAAFTSLIRQAGRDTLATAVTVSGAAFVAMGFISQAAETALVGVADAGDQSAVLALNHLQGRIPIVWTITVLTVAVSLAGLRTRLLPTWLGVAGLVAAGVFALGSMSSVLGRAVERATRRYSASACSSSGSCSWPSACGRQRVRQRPSQKASTNSRPEMSRPARRVGPVPVSR